MPVAAPLVRSPFSNNYLTRPTVPYRRVLAQLVRCELGCATRATRPACCGGRGAGRERPRAIKASPVQTSSRGVVVGPPFDGPQTAPQGEPADLQSAQVRIPTPAVTCGDATPSRDTAPHRPHLVQNGDAATGSGALGAVSSRLRGLPRLWSCRRSWSVAGTVVQHGVPALRARRHRRPVTPQGPRRLMASGAPRFPFRPRPVVRGAWPRPPSRMGSLSHRATRANDDCAFSMPPRR